MCRRLALCLVAALAAPAEAGPWPRAEGETLVFVGQEVHRDGWTQVYAEHGGRNLTFGLALGGRLAGMAGANASMPEEGRLRVFLRKPIRWRPGRGHRTGAPAWLFAGQVAAELDLNADGSTTPRLAFGLSAGRGFKAAGRDGWAALDLWVSGGPDAHTRTNIDTVIGIKPSPRLTLEIGLFGEFTDSASVAIAPTAQLNLRRAGALRAGLVVKDDRTALSIGWMRQF